MEKLLNQKLSVGTKLGYGLGSGADAVAYDWVTCFFIYFLTDFAEITPAFAGLIILVSIMWDAVTDPIIGTMSDNCKSKYGRRRPFIIGSALPLAISMILMFRLVPLEGVIENAYYLIMSIIFWTAYTAFNVPYFSLGVSLSYDEDERTSIRGYSTAYTYVGGLAATFLPTMLIGIFENNGMDEGTAWSMAGAILAIMTLISVVVCWRTTRGKEIMVHEEQQEKFHFKYIFDVIKPNSIRIVFIIGFLFYLTYTISNSSIMYFVESNLGLGEWEASFIYLANCVIGFIVVIGLSKLAYKIDKKKLFLFCALFGSVVQIGAKFVGVDSLADACVVEGLRTVGNASFWLFTYAFIYDATEIEEFRSGKRREGILNAYQSFIMKLGAAVGGLAVGLILEFGGYVGELYDEAPQSLETLDVIESMYTIYGGITMLVCVIFIAMLPITKKRYEALLKNLELKRQGEAYSTEEFKELL